MFSYSKSYFTPQGTSPVANREAVKVGNVNDPSPMLQVWWFENFQRLS